ncbi:MAG: alpha/beta hydrolase [Balneola sp.]|nr:MAG: alpha/beta hydrolase [Balneola sp.]
MKIYLIPGQGADYRLFGKLSLAPSFEIRYIHFELPEKGLSMAEYAQQLASQVDKSEPFILVGVSIGGMIATEMNDLLNPIKTIVVSSAKSKNELPKLYTIQRRFFLYKIIPGWISKLGAQFLQPIFEPVRNTEKEVFKQMLKDKDPRFLKRTIDMIVNWDRTSYDSSIISIHGDNDNTIPIRNVDVDQIVENGSHLMIFTKATELSRILNGILTASFEHIVQEK